MTGTVTDKSGLLQLDAQHIAAWGGIFQGGVICGNLYGGLWVTTLPDETTLINSLSDRIGRKWVLAWLTVLLAVVSGISPSYILIRDDGLHYRATGSN